MTIITSNDQTLENIMIIHFIHFFRQKFTAIKERPTIYYSIIITFIILVIIGT